MIGVADGRYELKIGSSILTRRGGTDANAPESPRKAILRDWHVGILAPHFLENSGTCPKTDSKIRRTVVRNRCVSKETG